MVWSSKHIFDTIFSENIIFFRLSNWYRISTLSEKPKFSEEQRNIKPLKQKTKDRLTVIGILALESAFIYDSIDNFYKYILLKMPFNLFLAILSTIATAILLVFIILILISYLDKRKVLRSFQKWVTPWNPDLKVTSTFRNSTSSSASFMANV